MTGRGFVRGSAGRQRVVEEAERAKQKQEQRDRERNKPFRFRVAVGEEDREFIVLDELPDFFVYEHAMQDPSTGKWGLNVTCCREFDTCAVCESPDHRESSYNMILTVLDLKPYKKRDGTEVEFSRKLLVVKPSQHRKFIRLYQKNNTLRGALFVTSRTGAKAAAIGDDIEFDSFVSEEDLKTYTREERDKDGKSHIEDCSQPFVYEECFDEADPDYLRRLAGAGPVEGSHSANYDTPVPSRKEREAKKASFVDEEEDAYVEDDDDDLPYSVDEEAPTDPEPEKKPRSSGGRRSLRRAKA